MQKKHELKVVNVMPIELNFFNKNKISINQDIKYFKNRYDLGNFYKIPTEEDLKIILLIKRPT